MRSPSSLIYLHSTPTGIYAYQSTGICSVNTKKLNWGLDVAAARGSGGGGVGPARDDAGGNWRARGTGSESGVEGPVGEHVWAERRWELYGGGALGDGEPVVEVAGQGSPEKMRLGVLRLGGGVEMCESPARRLRATLEGEHAQTKRDRIYTKPTKFAIFVG